VVSVIPNAPAEVDNQTADARLLWTAVFPRVAFGYLVALVLPELKARLKRCRRPIRSA
jgi:hypothetical protein